MKRLLAAAASFGVVAAGVIMSTPAAAFASTTCDAPTAFGSGSSYVVTIGSSSTPVAFSAIAPGDIIHVAYTVAPGCEGTQVGLAAYTSPDTNNLSTTQTLVSDQLSTAASGVLTLTAPLVPNPCTVLQSPYPANGKGANTSGPPDFGAYNPTCSLPGAHGNEPNTGSVGKADAKNPPGQVPNGSDNNAGYECDRNNGIGKGNPAHTSCSGGSWQVDLFVGGLLQTIGPPNNYYVVNQTVDRLVASANG